MLNWKIFLLMGALLSSCSGYRLRQGPNNLFYNENIRSISIPMFINKTSYSHVSAPVTREISKVLATVPGLLIYNSDSLNSDAMLIGVISSGAREADNLSVGSRIYAGATLKNSIGGRSQFYVPTSSRYKITVRYFLIKKPNAMERKLLVSKMGEALGEQVTVNPKVIFNKQFNYNGSFNRGALETIDKNSPGLVNYTKTKKFFELSIEQVAKSAASDFRELILNVF